MISETRLKLVGENLIQRRKFDTKVNTVFKLYETHHTLSSYGSYKAIVKRHSRNILDDNGGPTKI